MHYNHVCSLETEKDFKTGKSQPKYAKLSLKNPKTKIYFKSMASIEKEMRRHRAKYSYIVHPLSIFRFGWIIFHICTAYISLIIIPINLNHGRNHDHSPESNSLEKFEIILDFFCIIDIIFTFFVGVLSKKEVILRPGSIARIYLQSPQFYIDCATSIPQYFVTSIIFLVRSDLFRNEILIYFEYYSLIKLLRLKKFLVYYHEIMEDFQKYYYEQSMCKYLLMIGLGLHWATCIFIVVLLFHDRFEDHLYGIIPSFDKGLLVVNDFTGLYCRSLYIVTSYLLANGLVATFQPSINFQVEPIVDTLIFLTLSAIGFFTSTCFVVLLLYISMSMNDSQTKYYQTISQLRMYIAHNDLPKNISDRLLTYYEYRYQKKYFREKKILDMLSDTLRKDIYLHSCRTLIESVALLKDLPSDIITDVVSNLKKEVYLYNDVIVKAGSSGDCMYFIAKGSVSVSTPTGKEICHLQDGAYFGEIALISKDQKRVANVVAIEICEMYRLDRRNFKMCFLSNTSHFKKIEQIAKERMEKTMLLEELHKKYITDKPKRKPFK